MYIYITCVRESNSVLGNFQGWKTITSWNPWTSSRQNESPAECPKWGSLGHRECQTSQTWDTRTARWWILGWFLGSWRHAEFPIDFFQKVWKEEVMWSYSGNLLKMKPIHQSVASDPICGRSNNPPPKRAKMRHATKVTLKAKLSNSGLPSQSFFRIPREGGFQWDQRCCWNPLGIWMHKWRALLLEALLPYLV